MAKALATAKAHGKMGAQVLFFPQFLWSKVLLRVLGEDVCSRYRSEPSVVQRVQLLSPRQISRQVLCSTLLMLISPAGYSHVGCSCEFFAFQCCSDSLAPCVFDFESAKAGMQTALSRTCLRTCTRRCCWVAVPSDLRQQLSDMK